MTQTCISYEVNLRLGDAVNDSCLIDLHEVAERHPLQNGHRLEVIAGSFASPDATEYDVVELAEVDSHGSRVNSLEWFTTDKAPVRKMATTSDHLRTQPS